MGCFWPNYIMFELKKYRAEICLIAFKIDTKFQGKLACVSKNWHGEFGNFLPGHLKVSKLGLWWDPFLQSRKCMSLKLTGEFCVMTMKNDAKFVEELTGQFKIDIRNLTFWVRSFARALENLKNLHFNGLLLSTLSTVYNVWAKKSIGSYVWWHWILIQHLKENWLALSKMIWGIIADFHQSTFESLKIWVWWDPFIQSRNCMSLKF